MVDGFAGDECNYNLTLTNVSCPCVILPVSLAYFSGSSLPDQVALDWHMDAEAGVRHYRVARSRDGQHFQHVAELPAQPAHAEGNSYHSADRQAPHGWNYYRVSAIDQNGQVEVLSTAAVQHGGSARQPQLHLDGSTLSWLLPDLEPLPTRLSLLDLQGRLLYSGQHQADGPGQAIRLALPPLSPGVYLLRSENAAGNWSQRFVNPEQFFLAIPQGCLPGTHPFLDYGGAAAPPLWFWGRHVLEESPSPSAPMIQGCSLAESSPAYELLIDNY